MIVTTVDEYAQKVLSRILEIGQQQAEPVTERMHQISNEGLRFYYQALLRPKLAKITDLVVPYGPFAGLCMAPDFLPMLIGSYEAELHDTIRGLSHRGYQRIVNIGCGDGYYAVGLARLLPSARVFALDSDQTAQTACRSLAELNGVAERMTILGECTPTILRDLVCPATLIVCDCEGSERTLLDPVAIPALAFCDILVEMHDFICPDTSSTLQARFSPTHTTTVIPPSARDPSAYPILESFTEFDRLFALCEFRPGPTPWGLFVSNMTTAGS